MHPSPLYDGLRLAYPVRLLDNSCVLGCLWQVAMQPCTRTLQVKGCGADAWC
jgi:hypothetical protein